MAKEKDLRFDPKVLQSMQEPLTVRVEKIKGNVRQPIELPPKDNAPPGTHWTRDDVLCLENWLLTKWSGGGYYRASVTDAKGTEMTWEFVYDPRIYPERVPPNTAEAAVLNSTVGAPPNSAPVVPPSAQPLGSSGSWLASYSGPPQSGPVLPPTAPSPTPPQAQPAAPAVPPQPPGQGQGPWGYPPGTWWTGQPQWSGPWASGPWTGQPQWWPSHWQEPEYRRLRHERFERFDRDRFDRDDERERLRREAEERQKALEERLRQQELERKELEYKANLDRIQQQQAQQIAELRQQANEQIRSLQEEIRRLLENKTKPEDEELRRLREQLAEQQLAAIRQQSEQQILALREQLARMAEKPAESEELRRLREEQERQRREMERERERFEQQRREELMRQEIKEQKEALERQIQALIQAQSARANDPLIDALKETARLQAEQMREIARMQQQQTDKISAFMVPPAQLAKIMLDGRAGTDGLIKNVVDSVNGIVNMYKSAAEHAMQISGGGSDPPVARIIQESMARAGEVAERYLTMKRDQMISEAKVKQAQAQAQAEAAKAAAAAAQARLLQTPVSAGLAGVPVRSNGYVMPTPMPTPTVTTPPVSVPTSPTAAAAPPAPSEAPTSDAPSAPSTASKAGPTEEEMFGVALESVRRLRKGVEEGKLNPEQAVDAILQGVEYVTANQLTIPAFTLFQQERWADFIDVLLPDAPQEFKTECVRILTEEVEVVEGDESDEDEAAEAAN